MLYFLEKLIIIGYWNWFQTDAKLLGGGKLGLDLQEWGWCSACLFIYSYIDCFRLFEGSLSGSELLSKQFGDLLETGHK